MLLAIDIGNTNITLGVFTNVGLAAKWRIATDEGKQSDEYAMMVDQLLPYKGVSPSDIEAVSICSVVPPLNPTFEELCTDYFKIQPLVVGRGTKTGVKILYDNPKDVGSDRIVDAAAALKLYGGPLIIVDMGTAMVFDAITSDGNYLGGAIAPGIGIAADSLFHNTSLLRRVDLSKPPEAIGRNTEHAIQSGLVLGTVEMIKGMVTRFDKELGGGSKVIGTGGMTPIIQSEIDIFDHINEDLTLVGLKLIYEMN